MNPKEVGNLGERIACYYLEKKGYKVLDKNYFKERSAVSKGEIDVIAERDKIISFVEVKTLTQSVIGGLGYSPEDKVDFQKQRKLIKLAQDWLSEKKISLESKWQIDVISVKLDSDFQKARVRHFENAVFDSKG